jgi:hypothetical protein
MAVKGDLSELSVVLAFLTFIGIALYMIAKRKAPAAAKPAATKQKRVTFAAPPPKPSFDVGSAPGWGGGRWLGHGDFLFRNRMDHPFQRMPDNAGHPPMQHGGRGHEMQHPSMMQNMGGHPMMQRV